MCNCMLRFTVKVSCVISHVCRNSSFMSRIWEKFVRLEVASDAILQIMRALDRTLKLSLVSGLSAECIRLGYDKTGNIFKK